MTDNEIIKALEKFKCVNCNGDCAKESCEDLECPLNLVKSALDLVNRQKAEIERLNAVSEICGDCHRQHAEKIERTKAEGIKEFAERLKNKMFEEDFLLCEPCDMADMIDDLVKEMVGE